MTSYDVHKRMIYVQYIKQTVHCVRLIVQPNTTMAAHVMLASSTSEWTNFILCNLRQLTHSTTTQIVLITVLLNQFLMTTHL